MKIVLSNIIGKDSKIQRVYIICKNGLVQDILPYNSMINPKLDIINLLDYIISPWLFNVHCHLGESLYNFSEDEFNKMTISKYIEYTERINKKLSIEARANLWNKSAMLTAKEQLANCITGICAARCADICKATSLLYMSGYPLMRSVKLNHYSKLGLEGFKNYYECYNSPQGSVGIFLHSLYTTNNNELEIARDAINIGSEFMIVHISEDLETRLLEVSKYGKSPIDVLLHYGILNKKTILVHGGYLNEAELEKIAISEASLVVCPISNNTLQTKMPNIYKIKQLGINWCIASDGKATGKTFSLLRQAKVLWERFPKLTSKEIYDSITISPSKIFRRSSYSGIIEKGIESKFILIKKMNTLTESLYNFINLGIYNKLII